MNEKPLIVIVGETASGKTSASIELAKKIGGEVISADSRTVYREMNIGTAKPDEEEMDGVPHHLIDVVDPDEHFNIAMWQKLSKKCIQSIRNRGKYPIIVGGSGLYLNTILFDYDLDANTRRDKIIPNTILVGIKTDKRILEDRIAKRAQKMLDDGVVAETEKLIEKYGRNARPLQKNAYGEIQKAVDETLADRIVFRDRRLAKKQRTWFRANPEIIWLPREQIVDEIISRIKM